MRSVWLCVMMILSMCVHAQNFAEWTQQKKTQIKYLAGQVAALQVYIELGQKGYAVYRDGLTLIGEVKGGEFNLHKKYFTSLSDIKPRIGASPEGEEMRWWNEQVQLFRSRMGRLGLGAYNLSIRSLFDELSQKSSDHMAQLQLLTSGGNYQLNDEQRIEQLSKLHSEMSSLYSFAKSTYADAVLQQKVWAKEEKEMNTIERLHGLP